MTTSTRTIPSRWATAATIAMLAGGVLAGCSSPPDDGETASGGDRRGSAFAACMRDKGYDVADPEAGGASVQAPEGADQAQYAQDAASCAEESSPGGAGQAGAAQELPGSREQARKVGACLRANGFPDYPDDVDARQRWEPADQEAFDTAAARCEDEAGVPKGDQIGG